MEEAEMNPVCSEGATGWGIPGNTMTVSDSASGWGIPSDNGHCNVAASGWDCCSGSSSQGPIDRWGTQKAAAWEPEEEGQFMDEGTVPNEQLEHSVTFAQQVPMSEYAQRTREYTQQAVADLVSSREYQRFHTRCTLCWCSWSEGQCSDGCAECGGFSMHRPCPICRGKCGSMWARVVDMSHNENEAHWDGECRLPEKERAGYMQQYFMEPATEQDILDGMEQLQTD